MAKYAVEETEEVVVPVKSKVEEEVIPDNVVTLSTGIRVQFLRPLPQSIRQVLVISSFNDMNLDSAGRVKDNLTSAEQLGVAKKMYDFNGAILINGLMTGSIKIYDGLPKDGKWLAPFKINPMIKAQHPDLDFNEPLHLEFLYLFYNAFLDAEDYEILSQKMLND